MTNDEMQYNQIKQIIDAFSEKLEDVKVIFKSNDIEDEEVSFASYQFPVSKFDENVYETLKKYAELDYEISKRNDLNVGKSTKFKFVDPKSNTMVGIYNYQHTLEFLDQMSSGYKM